MSELNISKLDLDFGIDLTFNWNFEWFDIKMNLIRSINHNHVHVLMMIIDNNTRKKELGKSYFSLYRKYLRRWWHDCFKWEMRTTILTNNICHEDLFLFFFCILQIKVDCNNIAESLYMFIVAREQTWKYCPPVHNVKNSWIWEEFSKIWRICDRIWWMGGIPI